MRLVAWNCNMALHRKRAALHTLKPDVAVLSECASPERLAERLGADGLSCDPVWIGANRDKGLAVLAFFESTPDYAHAYLDRLRPPFPLVADLGLQVYSRYRLESSWLGALRARLTRGAAYREATRLRIGAIPGSTR